jgi:hypothetical protein
VSTRVTLHEDRLDSSPGRHLNRCSGLPKRLDFFDPSCKLDASTQVTTGTSRRQMPSPAPTYRPPLV